MKRINYLVSPWERVAGIAPPPSIAPALRGPLVALFGSLALVGALHGVQQGRLQHAVREGEIEARRLDASQAALRRADAVEADVARLRALLDHVEDVRRSGAERASEIASIGNGIPAGASLSAVRVEHDGYALEGHGEGLSAVGSTMAALATIPSAAGARLLSVQDDRLRHGVIYAIELEMKR